MDLNLFESLQQAQELAMQWMSSYNHERPHTALGGITPRGSITNPLFLATTQNGGITLSYTLLYMRKESILPIIQITLITVATFLVNACESAISRKEDIQLPIISTVVTETQQSTIYSLTSIAENSQNEFNWGYAENIDDGRGITFGIIGFTSGTYDGTLLIQRIAELDPNHELVAYLPAFKAIDATTHDENGLCSITTGLETFIDVFNDHGSDPVVKQAQLEKMKELYWQPAIIMATEIGATYAITLGQLYDACVNHGADGDSNDMGLRQLVELTTTAMNGTPATGVNEEAWLHTFLSLRQRYLGSDPTWFQAEDRVNMYRRILKSGNVMLATPLMVSCYGDSFTINGTENL